MRQLAAVVLLVAPAVVHAQLGPYGNVLLEDAAPEFDAQFGEVVAMGDFDGDGDQDLAVGSRRFGASAGRVTVFINRQGRLQRGLFSGEFTGESGELLGWALATCDVDANGADELIVGVPGDSNHGGSGAGAVRVYTLAPIGGLDGHLWTLRQTLAQGDLLGSVSVEGDRLGSALACGDFNNDTFGDLAIGVPDKEIGLSVENGGQIAVIHGSATGLSSLADELWSQDTVRDGAGVSGVAEDNDRFGSVLAAGDFNDDGHDDLAIGVPDEDVDGHTDAGVVQVLFGSANGLTPTTQSLFHADYLAGALSLGDAAAANDRFGAALAVGDFDHGDFFLDNNWDDLAIGAPYKSRDGISSAGVAYVLYGGFGADLFADADLLAHADSADAGQAHEHFGHALAAGAFGRDTQDDLAVGRPGRGIELVDGAGEISVFHGVEYSGLQTPLSQTFFAQRGYASAPPDVLSGYGSALATGDIDGDGMSDLAVGIRDQQVGAIEQAGAVQMIFTRGLFADHFEL